MVQNGIVRHWSRAFGLVERVQYRNHERSRVKGGQAIHTLRFEGGQPSLRSHWRVASVGLASHVSQNLSIPSFSPAQGTVTAGASDDQTMRVSPGFTVPGKGKG